MAKLSDLWKKGTNAPTTGDLVEGGLGIDILNKKFYSKAQDGTIFEVSGSGGGGDVINNVDGGKADTVYGGSLVIDGGS